MDKRKDKKDTKIQKTKDKKQDTQLKKQKDEIKKLKLELKDLAGKYLKKKKKQEKNPKKYEKIKKRLTKRTTEAKSKGELSNLINMLKAGGRQIERVTGQPIQTALNPATIGTIPERILKDQVQKAKKTAEGPATKFNKAKEAFLNAKDKYNNSTLDISDIDNLYEKTSDFAKSVQEILPSKETLLATYNVTKDGLNNIYDYFKRFMNRRASDINQNPIDLNQAPRTGSQGPGAPQEPSPAPTPAPTRPPDMGGSGGLQAEPVQNQTQPEQQAPRQMTTEELQDQGLISRVSNSWVGGGLIGAGALLGGGAIYRSYARAREEGQNARNLVDLFENQGSRLSTTQNLRDAVDDSVAGRNQAREDYAREQMERNEREFKEAKLDRLRDRMDRLTARIEERRSNSIRNRLPELRSRDRERTETAEQFHAGQRVAESASALDDADLNALRERRLALGDVVSEETPQLQRGIPIQRGEKTDSADSLITQTDSSTRAGSLATTQDRNLPSDLGSSAPVSRTTEQMMDLLDAVEAPPRKSGEIGLRERTLSAQTIAENPPTRGTRLGTPFREEERLERTMSEPIPTTGLNPLFEPPRQPQPGETFPAFDEEELGMVAI